MGKETSVPAKISDRVIVLCELWLLYATIYVALSDCVLRVTVEVSDFCVAESDDTMACGRV